MSLLNLPGFGASERPSPIKKGEYLCEVTGLITPDKLDVTRKNEDVEHFNQMAILFKIAEDGTEKDKRVSKFFVLNKIGIGQLKAMLEDLGVIDSEFDSDDIPAEDAVGKQLFCTIGIRTYKGNEQNTIASFKPVTE